MTLSKEQRHAELIQLLRIALVYLGSEALYAVVLSPADPVFKTVPPATWEEAREASLLERDLAMPEPSYRFTGTGWLAALDADGALGSADLQRDLGRLAAALKGRVKGRQAPAQVTIDAVAHDSGLSVKWVYNAVEANLLEASFARRGATWHDRHRGSVLVVPPTFGIEPIDLDANLRARIEELKTDLEDHREQLREFTCPTCAAPVVGQTPIDHEYGTSWYRQFECGRADEDGTLREPCPSSPEFPAIDEFELVLNPDDNSTDWGCFLRPTTAKARRLTSIMAWAKTADEAERRAREAYARKAKRWTR